MKYLIFISLFLLSATASAQEPAVADSILMHQQSRQNFEAAKWGATQLIGSRISKLSVVGLSYFHQQGHFRTAQQAEKTSNARFAAEGISSIDRFKLYGYFSFDRTWQDSLAFSQKGIEDDFTPYYYIAGKAGKFERQRYLGGGIINYSLIRDKLFIGTGIDYLYHTSARSVDPRSMVTTFSLKFNPTISYKISNHLIGAGITAGYGDEKVAIDYKNDDFKGTLLYPDRISYLNYGYGYLEINQSDFIRRNKFTGVNLNYVLDLSQWNIQGRLRYLISKEDNQYPKTNSINDETFGSFQLETYALDVVLNHNGVGGQTDQLVLNMAQYNGDDHLVKLAARNYTYNATAISASYRHAHYQKEQPYFSYFASLAYQDTYQRDAAADHTSSFTYLHPTIGATLHVEQQHKNLFSVQLGIGARLPLQNELVVPVTQYVNFTQGVAFPDYWYWASKVGEINTAFNYSTSQLFSKFRTGFELNGTYLRKLSMPPVTIATPFVPGKDNFSLSLGAKLYF
ncbi:MAG: hypothetical protein REI78_03330 [Pedobacter sp.]|nr:hypothetical protein [Pedobacter sp.]MDQ8052026.1 hypothetical protein [Pedobacter sp.]